MHLHSFIPLFHFFVRSFSRSPVPWLSLYLVPWFVPYFVASSLMSSRFRVCLVASDFSDTTLSLLYLLGPTIYDVPRHPLSSWHRRNLQLRILQRAMNTLGPPMRRTNPFTLLCASRQSLTLQTSSKRPKNRIQHLRDEPYGEENER